MSAAATGPHVALAVLIGAGAGVLAAPYLARLTRSVPDRDERRWWAGRPAGPGRVALTALAGAVLGGLGGAAAGFGALLPAFVALALLAAPLVVIDYETHRLPNRLVHPAAAAALVLLALAALVQDEPHRLLRAIEAAAVVFAVLFALAFAAPRSFGLGDVRLGGVLAAYLGWFGWAYVYYGIFAGFLLGTLAAVGLLVTRRGGMKTALAFGPSLVLGALLVVAFDLVPSLG